MVIGADLHRRLVDVAQQNNSTLFMVVHAALAVVLARLSGTEDITVGTPIAGRGERALDDLVGMFVNTLVLRTSVDAGVSFTDLLSRSREADLAAFAHADVPFRAFGGGAQSGSVDGVSSVVPGGVVVPELGGVDFRIEWFDAFRCRVREWNFAVRPSLDRDRPL